MFGKLAHSSRVLAWASVTMLIVLAGAALYIYGSYERTTSELVMERDRQLAYLTGGRFKEEVSEFAGILGTLSRMPEIYRGDARQQQSVLERARHRLGVFDGGVILLDNFGQVALAQPKRPDLIGADWSQQDFFRELLAGQSVVYSNAIEMGPNGGRAVLIGVPLVSDRGEFTGVLAGMFQIGSSQSNAFYASIIRLRISGSHVFLVDGLNRILYDSAYAGIGEDYSEHAVEPIPARSGPSAGRARDVDGNAIVAAYAPVPGTDWMLAIEEDWATAAGASRRYAVLVMGLMGLGMVLPTAGLGLLLRHRRVELREQERSALELSAACLLQQALLPKHVPVLPGWDIAVYHRPSGAADGGFYDFLFLADGRLMVTVGDVHDRGPSAMVLLAMTRGVLRSAGRRMLGPADALNLSNEVLVPETRPDVSVSCVYGLLDPASGKLVLANAGHQPPHRCSDSSATDVGVAGQPLGVALQERYEETSLTVGPGERVVMWSKSLADERRPSGEPWSSAWLPATFTTDDAGQGAGKDGGAATAIVETLRQELDALGELSWSPGGDVTVVVLERRADE